MALNLLVSLTVNICMGYSDQLNYGGSSGS